MNDPSDTQSLKSYIEKQIHDQQEGGMWEYHIRPTIQDTITKFSKEESERFSHEILNWDEDVLYELADAIIFGDNNFLEQDYLYCQIFLKITNQENLAYLKQNLFATYNGVDHESKPLEFFLEMKEKLEPIWTSANDMMRLPNGDIYLTKILDEMIYRKSQSGL